MDETIDNAISEYLHFKDFTDTVEAFQRDLKRARDARDGESDGAAAAAAAARAGHGQDAPKAAVQVRRATRWMTLAARGAVRSCTVRAHGCAVCVLGGGDTVARFAYPLCVLLLCWPIGCVMVSWCDAVTVYTLPSLQQAFNKAFDSGNAEEFFYLWNKHVPPYVHRRLCRTVSHPLLPPDSDPRRPRASATATSVTVTPWHVS